MLKLTKIINSKYVLISNPIKVTLRVFTLGTVFLNILKNGIIY
jgi:hypothetical protein